MKSLWDTELQLFLKDCENWIFKFWNLWNCISGLRLAASMSPDVSKSPSRMSRSRSLRRTAWHRLQPPTRDLYSAAPQPASLITQWHLLRGLALLLKGSDLPASAFIASVTREVSSCPSLHISSWKDEVWEKSENQVETAGQSGPETKWVSGFPIIKSDIQYMGRT